MKDFCIQKCQASPRGYDPQSRRLTLQAIVRESMVAWIASGPKT